MKLNIQQLRHFRAFAGLRTAQLELLADAAEAFVCQPGATVLDTLLEGSG